MDVYTAFRLCTALGTDPNDEHLHGHVYLAA